MKKTHSLHTLKWGVLWRSNNMLDGRTRHLLGAGDGPVLFDTRDQARTYIKERYGYIATRLDLREEPHGLRMPVPVKVRRLFEYEDGD